jgi:dTDP-4-dehydrorhamnose 3,5-epimerase
MSNRFRQGTIEDVVISDLRKFLDSRGWLCELFRHDELEKEFYPVMTYISSTRPGVTRGPHEHVDQADFFCFLGPSTFKLRLWDNRSASSSFNCVMTVEVGETNPKSVLIPAGVVHAYKNVGTTDGVVVNCPNRLYMGHGKRDPIDEIRHEDDPETVYRIDD